MLLISSFEPQKRPHDKCPPFSLKSFPDRHTDKMVLFNSSSLSSTGNLLRKRRKCPQLPYKGTWQQTFNEQQAMEAVKKAAAAAAAEAKIPESQSQSQSQSQHSPGKPPPHLLSVLVNSFNIYGCDPTPSAYSFIIKTMTQKCLFDQLPPVLDHIENIEKFDPPERIFIDLIRNYGDANKLQDAIEIFFRIPKFRCTPSVYSLNALLSVLCRRKEGLQMVHQVLLKSQPLNIRLEESSFRILIIALCKIKKVGYAIELLNLMPDYGYNPDSRLYSSILSAMCESKDLSSVEVLGFLQEMRKVGLIPNEVDYNNVISFLVNDGKGMDGFDLLNQMKSDRMKPDVVCYTKVLDGIISAGDFQKAEEVFDEMLVLGVVPDVYTYNVYINGLCKMNKHEMGFKMLGLMEELGCMPNVVTYNTLVCAFCKVGKVKRAREISREMRLKGGVEGNLHTYRFLIDGFISEGEVMEAFGLLEEMFSKGFVPLCLSVDEMICRLCKQDHVCEALQVLRLMVERAVAPGARSWEALLLVVVSGSELGLNESNSAKLENLISLSGTQINQDYGPQSSSSSQMKR